MKKHLLRFLFACNLVPAMSPALAQTKEFSFGAISRPLKAASANTVLRDAIEKTDAENLAFIVASGIKATDEPCTDRIYNRKKSLFNDAKHGLIVSLAAGDWAECRNENGRSAAISRLNRVRELFFMDELSLGGTKIPVVRQSAAAKFRSYGENVRWEIGDAMFATINLPDNNNHYLSAAGRNSEFEDRLIANRDWLHRVFVYATLKKADGLVLFCDGNPMAKPDRSNLRRDGFAETRKQILAGAAKFPGKVLIVHGGTRTEHDKTDRIIWKGNLGTLELRKPWIKVNVNPAVPAFFAVDEDATSVDTSPTVN